MRSFATMHDDCTRSGQPCAYWGEHGEWMIARGHHRDSDSLEEANFRAMLIKLGGESDTVVIERENHWAVGWVEFILIDPADTARIAIAEKIIEDLEDYQVIDEELWSNLEYDNFWEFAKGELESFDGWEDVLSELLHHGNYDIGCDSSEWEAIQDARAKLEEVAPLYEQHASCPIDPRQMPLF